ncbi:NADH-quinone oxidoreductase subunit I [bacterium]|nr:NADH-quinone oxidoreductase subunit I [bacterium]
MKQRNPFAQYWANVWAGIATTFIGMKLTLGYFFDYVLFRKTFTMRYPEERPVVPEGYRGRHKLDEKSCIVCQQCAKACPVDAIVIEAVGRGKDAMLTRFTVDYGKCLFCSLCTEACSQSSITMTKEYDLAEYSRQAEVRSLIKLKTPEQIKAHEAMLAQKEAEKKAKLEAAKKAEAEKKAAEAAAAEKKPEQPGGNGNQN